MLGKVYMLFYLREWGFQRGLPLGSVFCVCRKTDTKYTELSLTDFNPQPESAHQKITLSNIQLIQEKTKTL